MLTIACICYKSFPETLVNTHSTVDEPERPVWHWLRSLAFPPLKLGYITTNKLISWLPIRDAIHSRYFAFPLCTVLAGNDKCQEPLSSTLARGLAFERLLIDNLNFFSSIS